jgi:hypothetical protein
MDDQLGTLSLVIIAQASHVWFLLQTQDVVPIVAWFLLNYRSAHTSTRLHGFG